ncbi:MAG TPA: hypothetical protein VLA00_09775 [Xanthobacteraceae bacterium]|nr:hypothetical protein [Xanthobacteraceae bacterium]
MAERREGTIDLYAGDPQALLDTMDPFPFRERAIDHDVDEYIYDHAETLPAGMRIRINIHLPREIAAAQAASELAAVFGRHFVRRAERASRELSSLMRTGRLALIVGIAVLAVSLAVGQGLVKIFPESRLASVVMEGLVIFGWVANWRPMEIFLFEWWPFIARRRLYRRLAQADITVKASEPAVPR